MANTYEQKASATDTVTAGAFVFHTNVAGSDIAITKVVFGADGADPVVAATGAGAVSTGVQRMTLASDDPAVALLGTIDTDTGAMVTDLAAIEVLLTSMDTDTAAMVVDLAAIEVLLGTIDADTGGILTAVQLIDDAIYVDDVPFTAGNNKVMAVGFRYDDTTPDGVTQNDIGYARMSSRREIYTTIRDAAGNERGLNVAADGSIAVTGTFWQATQPVSGTVTANLSATDNAVLDAIAAAQLPDGHNVTIDNASIAVTGTFWQATQPVSGTVTAELSATDNAVLDTIATPVATIGTTPLQRVAIFDGSDTQITTFGGGQQYTEGDTDASITGTAMLWEDAANTLATVSAGSPLPVAIISGAGSGGTASDDDADFTAGTTAGTPAMGVYQSTPGSVTDGDLGIVGITSTRALRTAVEGTVTVDLGANNDVTVTGTVSGTGTAGSAATGVLTVQGIASMTALVVDGSAVTQPVSGTVTANLSATDNAVLDNIDVNTGSTATYAGNIDLATTDIPNVIGTDGAAGPTKSLSVAGTESGGTLQELRVDADGHLQVDVLSAASTAVTNAGTFAVQPTAAATGGATPGKLISAASTNATSVKGSAGTLYMLVAMNVNAAARYLKLYNKATSPTVGTDTPVLTLMIPGNTAGAGVVVPIPSQGIAFGTGIALALTTAAADSDTGAVAANEIVLSYAYN